MERKTNHRKWVKLSMIMMIVTMILSFTGCIRYKTTAEIHKDGTVDLEILYATLESAQGGSADILDVEKLKSMSNLDWSVEAYEDTTDDGYCYRGYTLTKANIKLEDLQSELRETDLGFDNFTLVQEDDLYIINWDASEQKDSAEKSGGSLDSVDGYMKFVLKVPGAIETNNATSRNGKTLEWDLLETPSPFCKFKLTGGGFPIWAIIVIGVVVVGGIVALIIVLRNKKKNAYIPTYRTQSELDAMNIQSPSNLNEQMPPEKPVSPFASPIVPDFSKHEPERTPDYFTSAPAREIPEETTHSFDNDILKPEVKLPIWANPLSEEQREALNDDEPEIQ